MGKIHQMGINEAMDAAADVFTDAVLGTTEARAKDARAEVDKVLRIASINLYTLRSGARYSMLSLYTAEPWHIRSVHLPDNPVYGSPSAKELALLRLACWDIESDEEAMLLLH